MDRASFDAFINQTTTWVVLAVPNLIAAILILIVGVLFARWVSRLMTRILAARPHVDQTLTPVLAALLRYFILIITFIAVLGQLGVQIASMLAVLGAAGLAIGLALQGTLSNIAAGLMLLWLRPFRAGESIETSSVSGVVQEIGLFATVLRTGDGVFHFVPNQSLWNTPIKNLTRNGTRRMEVKFAVPHSTDLAIARQRLIDLAAADQRVHKTPKPDVFVTSYNEATVEIILRAWAATGDHARTMADLAEAGSAAIQAALPVKELNEPATEGPDRNV